jgi:hypothetical protein
VEGDSGGDGFGSKGAGVFLFIEEFDSAYPNGIVIEIEFLGVIEGVTDLDAVTDIGRGDLIEVALEADGGIVVDDALVAQEKDLIQFALRESADGNAPSGEGVAIDGALIDAGMYFMVIILLEPDAEGVIEIIEADPILDRGEEAVPDGPKKSFHFSPGRAVVGFRMDEGDACQGAATGEEIGRETGAIIHIEAFGDAVGEEGFLQDEAESADGLRSTEAVSYYHTGVIIEDGTEDGLGYTSWGFDLGSVHEVADPQVVDMIDLEGLTDIASFFG